jgi:hypothetical protein
VTARHPAPPATPTDEELDAIERRLDCGDAEALVAEIRRLRAENATLVDRLEHWERFHAATHAALVGTPAPAPEAERGAVLRAALYEALEGWRVCSDRSERSTWAKDRDREDLLRLLAVADGRTAPEEP